MKIASKIHLCSAVAGLMLATSTPLSAVLIYNDSVNDLGYRFNMNNNVQYGDEIVPAGTERQLQTFSFEYFGVGGADNGATFVGNVQVRLRLYVNNGPLSSGVPTPGTMFFDSGFFSVGTTPRATLLFQSGVDWAAAGLAIPTTATFPDVTFAVEFTGAGTGDLVGLDVYSPPVVGTSFADYWENTGTDASPIWTLKTIQGLDVNFAAQANATAAVAPVPETFNTFAGLLIGLGLLVGARGLYRNKWFVRI